MEANFELNAKTYTQVMVNAWLDKDFKDRLLENPTEVLKEYGIRPPDNTIIRVADGETSVQWDAEGALVLPLPPAPTDISDQGIEQAVERQCDVSVDACCCCCCA